MQACQLSTNKELFQVQQRALNSAYNKKKNGDFASLEAAFH